MPEIVNLAGIDRRSLRLLGHLLDEWVVVGAVLRVSPEDSLGVINDLLLERHGIHMITTTR